MSGYATVSDDQKALAHFLMPVFATESLVSLSSFDRLTPCSQLYLSHLFLGNFLCSHGALASSFFTRWSLTELIGQDRVSKADHYLHQLDG